MVNIILYFLVSEEHSSKAVTNGQAKHILRILKSTFFHSFHLFGKPVVTSDLIRTRWILTNHLAKLLILSSVHSIER